MKKIRLTVLGILSFAMANAFCGFYVAKADGKLFNKSSQIIMVRNSETNRNTITMANDYEGDFKEFAMVVPVPVVLKEEEIRVVRKDIFERFDSYSAPRLAEYHDQDPCWEYRYDNMVRSKMRFSAAPEAAAMESVDKEEYTGVVIEAKYEVGEYDILILSATESNGLKRWLTDNGYKIPSTAEEVLDPYIKDEMKFFVAKVNTKKLGQRRGNYLSPIQISFQHKKFMLPIRLGMANANGPQDMIAYFLTQKGRVETANYKTEKMPSNQEVPLFVEDHFGNFYKSTFSKAWTNNKKSAFLEYSWNLDGSNFTKCDPCNTTPPKAQELTDAGVDWLQMNQNRWGADYSGNLQFTRLHVRYDRENFPQDLMFIETKNRKNFQCRYVLRHPAKIADESCAKVLPYYKGVQNRREKEMENLASLTWWETNRYQAYLEKYDRKVKKLERKQNQEKNESLIPFFPKGNIPPAMLMFAFGIILITMSTLFLKRKSLI